MSMPSACEKTIFRTLAYFSFFSYPLTRFEIWKWQLQPNEIYALDEIWRTLDDSSWLAKRIHERDGFFCLADQDIDAQVHDRHDRFLDAVEKYKKLRRVLAYVCRLPYTQGVALCNSVAFHYTQERSDIDLFVLTDSGRVWSTRLHGVLPLLVTRQRPGEARSHPIDMSFFASIDHVEFSDLKIGSEDPYLAMWIRSLIPLYEREPGVFDRFFSANSWAKHVLPATKPARRARAARSAWSGFLPVVPFSERFSRRVQEQKFPEDIQRLANTGSQVIVNDLMLKFHKNDRRQEIARFLQNRTSSESLNH